MAVNFPVNRNEAGLGFGPLQRGDSWRYGSIEYTWVITPDGTGIWSAKGINVNPDNYIAKDDEFAGDVTGTYYDTFDVNYSDEAGNSDKLDNQDGSYYLAAGNLTGTVPDARLPDTISSDITGNAATADLADKATNADSATTADQADKVKSSLTLTFQPAAGDPTTIVYDGSTAQSLTFTDTDIAQDVITITGGTGIDVAGTTVSVKPEIARNVNGYVRDGNGTYLKANNSDYLGGIHGSNYARKTDIKTYTGDNTTIRVDGSNVISTTGNIARLTTTNPRELAPGKYVIDSQNRGVKALVADGADKNTAGQILATQAWVLSQGFGGDAVSSNYTYRGIGTTRTIKNRLEDSFSILDFGAESGKDSTAGVASALAHATATGKTCHVPAGNYLISSGIAIQLNKNLKVVCEGDVVFTATDPFPPGTKLFDFYKLSGDGASFMWEGGEIDGSNMPVQVEGTAPDLMTIRGEKIKDSTIKGVFFVVNRNPSNNRGDTALYLAQGENYHVTDCTFLGAVDAGIYVSATTSGRGKNCIIQNCVFNNCKEVAVISKRSFEQHIVTNNIVEGGRNGIIIGGAADGNLNPGKHTIIANNFVSRVTYTSLEARLSDFSVIEGNVVEDFGFIDNGGGSFTGVTQAHAIGIQGSRGCIVANNTIGMTPTYVSALDPLTGGNPAEDNLPNNSPKQYGILLRADVRESDGQTIPAVYNNITNNVIANVPYAICAFGASTYGNTFDGNTINNETVRVRVEDTVVPSLTVDPYATQGRIDTGYNNRKTLQVVSGTDTRREGVVVDGALTVKDNDDSDALIQNGSLELYHKDRGGSQVRSFIDFKDVTSDDWDCRVSQENNDLVLRSKVGNIVLANDVVDQDGNPITGGLNMPGVYSILDPIFGGPINDGGQYQGSWHRAFNHALQGTTETGSFHNGPIERLLVPAGTYQCKAAILRTRVVSIIGEGLGSTTISMGDSAAMRINVDGTEGIGQICLANKGLLSGIRFTGTVTSNSSVVLCLRKYDNQGVEFGTLRGAQNDSADMDLPIIQCGFTTAGGGGDTNAILKYVGRNAYIFGCAFNTDGTAIHLSFPNKPGSTTAGDTCGGNNSLANDSQGGIYGWRRNQVIGCYFHLKDVSTCIVVSGKYQCRGLVVANNLSDIGGQLLKFVPLAPENAPYTNGKGGGLSQASITGNTCLNLGDTGGDNPRTNRPYIALQSGPGTGYYESCSITGNCFAGSDETYTTPGGCPGADKVKRTANAIKIDGGAVVNGLSITGNSFAYFLKSAIEISGGNKKGINITGNNLLNCCIDEGDAGFAVDISNQTSGTCTGNSYVKDMTGATVNGFRGTNLLGVNDLNSVDV